MERLLLKQDHEDPHVDASSDGCPATASVDLPRYAHSKGANPQPVLAEGDYTDLRSAERSCVRAGMAGFDARAGLGVREKWRAIPGALTRSASRS